MKKADFISNTENWLVEHDIKDAYFQLSASQISKTNINYYISSVRAMLEDKAPHLLDTFNQSIKKSKVRGIEKSR